LDYYESRPEVRLRRSKRSYADVQGSHHHAGGGLLKSALTGSLTESLILCERRAIVRELKEIYRVLSYVS
jgi:hypothetical protein